MDKIKCRRCGKEIKVDFSDSRVLCKKCRKIKVVLEKRTTKIFDF